MEYEDSDLILNFDDCVACGARATELFNCFQCGALLCLDCLWLPAPGHRYCNTCAVCRCGTPAIGLCASCEGLICENCATIRVDRNPEIGYYEESEGCSAC